MASASSSSPANTQATIASNNGAVRYYLIDDDDVYHPSHGEFARVYISDDRTDDVLFYMPQCKAYPFTGGHSRLTIQRAAVGVAIYKIMGLRGKDDSWMIYDILVGIPDELIVTCMAISGCREGDKVVLPTDAYTIAKRNFYRHGSSPNHSRLEYLTLGPVDIVTFAEIVIDAYNCLVSLGLYIYARSLAIGPSSEIRVKSPKDAIIAAHNYDSITQMIELIGWYEEWGDDNLIIPRSHKTDCAGDVGKHEERFWSR